ncbi:ABC transporter permease subunit [Streptacidiphilus sp. P02-A3a]|uniref:ABC transporter permease subunit n=1 Tax=Streptacidiphilus sp. P02-A3a TaxID=2704468 RepID=UPI0015FC600F|nr:ABC transporter permease subunit [Streptacidiphilus sp. P02-A3a]QMU67577.1 ABC transporter permease subunit [Streptacidiphilus sp. P02-A3a]
MSTTTATPQAAPRGVQEGKVTQLRVLNSEWIKLRTLRSTPITLLVAVVIMIGLGMLITWGRASHSGGPNGHADPINGAELSLGVYLLAQLAIGVLGVLIVSGEYSTGMIRASLSAVPKRLPVLWAKTLVYAAVVLVLMTITSLVAFYCGQAILSSYGEAVKISDPGVARVVFGTGLYLTVVGVFGVALGALIRNGAGAIATLVGVVFIVPALSHLLPSSWAPHIVPYLPSNAGGALLTVVPDPTMLAPWTGFGLMVGYAVVLLAVAGVLLKRRDA